MDTNITGRVIIDFLILLCVAHGLWFIALPLGIYALWSYDYFIEIVLTGFIHDILFGAISTGITGFKGVMISIVLLFIVAIIKTVVRK